MSILKRQRKRSRKEGTSLIGANIPNKIASYLSLYSLSFGTTKSSIFKNLLHEWMIETKEEYSEKDLINEVAIRALKAWINPTNKKRIHFNQFKSNLKVELGNRGLEDYSDEIIEIIENEKDKIEK